MNAKKFILDASRKIGVVVSRRKASALRSAFRRVCGTTTRDFMLVVLPLVLDRFFYGDDDDDERKRKRRNDFETRIG